MNAISQTHTPATPGAAKRLDEIGWGLFLIMLGTIWLIPSVPQGTWLVGTGLLLLGLNAVRHLRGVRSSGFTWVIGALALAAGLGQIVGVTLPLFAILLVVVGAGMLLKPLISRHA